MKFLFWTFQVLLAICVMSITGALTTTPSDSVSEIVLLVEVVLFFLTLFFWNKDNEHELQWKGMIAGAGLGIIIGIARSFQFENTEGLLVAMIRITCVAMPVGVTLAGISKGLGSIDYSEL